MKSIIFRGDMVRALLAGKKTETRREHKSPRFRAWEVVYVKESYMHFGNVAAGRQPVRADVKYKADGASMCRGGWARFEDAPMRDWWNKSDPVWENKLFMPEWASRIKLRILEARQEPLHNMTDTDALAEGVEATPVQTPLEVFIRLWDEIKGEGAWDSNPTVCVYRFERAS